VNNIQKAWWIYKGNKTIEDLKTISAPPWRQKKKEPTDDDDKVKDIYIPTQEEKELINTAIYLRRPLLITGKPRLGKSSLAKSVALDLGLDSMLHWHINTKSTLQDGLYSYDAIGRLHDKSDDITKYIKLGPLGSAFASKNKRVLLIDEIDKSDIDFPNDLLYIFEENEFTIPELERVGGKKEISLYNVQKDDREKSVEIENGRVICEDFPIVIITSNSEREFSSAFMRRCIHLHIEAPTKDELTKIVEAHFGEISSEMDEIIRDFLELRSDKHHLANDQLLSAIYLLRNKLLGNEAEKPLDEKSREIILESIWKSLS